MNAAFAANRDFCFRVMDILKAVLATGHSLMTGRFTKQDALLKSGKIAFKLIHLIRIYQINTGDHNPLPICDVQQRLEPTAAACLWENKEAEFATELSAYKNVEDFFEFLESHFPQLRDLIMDEANLQHFQMLKEIFVDFLQCCWNLRPKLPWNRLLQFAKQHSLIIIVVIFIFLCYWYFPMVCKFCQNMADQISEKAKQFATQIAELFHQIAFAGYSFMLHPSMASPAKIEP